LIAWFTEVIDPREAAHEFIETGICIAIMVVIALLGQRIPSRVAWAGCFLVGFACVLESTQEFVPAWSVHRSLLNQPKEVVELLQDEQTAVAVCKSEGSVRFSLHRSNVRNFASSADGELKDFLHEHPRTLMIVGPEYDPATVRRAMPSDVEIIRVVEGKGARFVLVQVRADVPKQLGPVATN
jgi:hypothetical protein